MKRLLERRFTVAAPLDAAWEHLARVEAWPKKSGQAPLVAFSDEQGDFVLHGLRPASHRLRVSARGHETLQQEAVEPNQAVHLVLTRP